MKTLLFLCGLLLAPLMAHASLRGTPFLQNPFACSLAAADKTACQSSIDDDENPCVWCDFAESGGICVSAWQGQEISNIVPQVTCDDSTTTVIMEEDDDTDTLQVPSDFWECLRKVEEEDCTCTWCNTESGFGVCLADAAAKAVEDCDFFDCDTRTSFTHVRNPVDVNCLAAGMGSNDAQSICDATLDSTGSSCVWCDVAGSGYGLCLSSEAASMAGQYLSCDDSTTTTTDDEQEEAGPNPNDFAECIQHGKEDDCNSDKCTWCNTLAGFGMCFSEQAMEIAKMYEPMFDCDKKEVILSEEVESPFDPTCLAAGFQGGDKDTCEETQDQDGNDCVYCTAGDDSTGLCLTTDQASMASQWLTCDEIEEDVFGVESPTDPTCFAAAFQADDAEATCHSTNDQEGSPCVWCSGPEPTMGVCLSSDQAAIAGQWLTCEEPTIAVEIESPFDPTCLVAGFQGGDKDSCEATLDQDGNKCAWCHAGDDSTTGLCMTTDQASMASQWLTCDDTTYDDVWSEGRALFQSPMDSKCLGAGYQEEDAEATCHSTNDHDGSPCYWCFGLEPSMGICLSSDQAAIAGQWLNCGYALEAIAEMS